MRIIDRGKMIQEGGSPPFKSDEDQKEDNYDHAEVIGPRLEQAR